MKRVSLLALWAVLLLARTATAQTIPAGFSEDIIATGLINPTDVAFLPDGRILLVEKNGIVRVYKNGAVLATPLIDIRTKVNDYWDRGMTAIAVDPDFATNGFVYLWYVFENDANDYDGPKTVRLTRITVSGDTASPASEVVLLGSISGASCGGQPLNADCIPADSPSHNGGTIKFAADKTIFVTTGDGASFNIIDELSLRAQDINSLSGKLLHITKTGQGISSNPFWNGSASAVRSKVYAYGFRNPLRATLKPGSGQPYVADVGLSAYEELDVATAGANLGWPCYEGPFRQPGFQDFAVCQSLYNAGDTNVKAPLVWYPHNNISSAIIGGAFYTGSVYPPAYQGAYFYGDYAQGFVNFLKVDANDALTGPVTTFATGEPGPVKFETGPNGDLYYVEILTGELRHLRYVIGQPASTRELSSISWTSASNGFGPVERDLSNGEDAARDGHTITLNGSVYPRGLGVHAPSDIRYQLDGQCTAFASNVGVDDEITVGGSVVFQVWADGVKLYDSGIMTSAMTARSVSLNIAGKQQLALIVTDGGDGTSSDHADWADATITCGGTSSPIFATAVSMPAGVSMHGVAIADLNGDTNLDIVAASAGSSFASVWLGNGNGTFGTRHDFPTGQTPKNIAVGDINKDGKLDLVASDQDVSTISVMLGTGTGSFGTKVEYPSCSFAHEVAIADFNGDTWPDVVVACWGGNVVSVLLNNKNGTFAAKVDLPTGLTPTSVVARDLNNDGKIDLAVANHGGADVSVLRGKGDGTFFPEVRYNVGQAPHSIRSGDLNNDGFIDLVTADESGDSVSVLLGKSDGTYNPVVSYPVGSVPKGVLVADLDGDGLLDILSTNTAGNYPNCCFPGGDTVTMLHGNGDGTFVLAGTYTVGTTPFSAAAGDFDKDGRLDVITANWHSNDVTFLHNVGTDAPPVISNVTAVNLKSTSATITWTTNEGSDGQVEYGLSTSYGLLSPIRATLVTSHQEVLTDLTPNTTYHYRVRSRDGSGGLTITGDHTFTSGTGTGGTTYVSDLTWTLMTNGWGPVEKDHSNGGNVAGDGGVIKLKTVSYTKGLGTNAASELRFALPTGCTQFVSDVGVDDEVSPSGSVIFQVFGDTTMLAQSAILTGSSPTVQMTADLTGHSELRLLVTDGGDGNNSDHGDWAGARLVCSQQSNTAPVATITSPASGTLFKVGDVITYAGSGTDAEDGALPAGNLSWNIVLHHCPDTNCHTHPFLTVTGAGGNFTVPDHGEGIFFEFNLTAIDSLGLSGTTQRIINPQTSVVNLNTVPSGLQVVYGGIQATAPVAVTSVVGSALTILAPSPQGTSTFVSWSDAGAQQHNVVVGTSPATYTATFNTGGTQTIYVSDLTWTSMTNGWGPVEKDRSNGESAAGDGAVLKIRGASYAKGLGAHAASDIRFAIPAGCTQFLSDVGIDDEVAPNGSVIFQVFGDTTMLTQSATLTGASAVSQLIADLTGRTQLRLVVTDAGNGNASDHGDWANARLICTADTTPPTVTAVTPLAGATGVGVTANVTATFSEGMTASTLTTTTVTLVPQGSSTPVTALVTYDAATSTVTLDPTANLTANTLYTATIKSGASGVKDVAGNPLATDKTWTFTTSSAASLFVSDLTQTSMTNGWGPAEKDRSNGGNAAGDGLVMKIRGVTYAKGVGAHAASDIRYAIPAGCTQFTSDIGIDDEVAPNGSVIFQVWGDAVMLAQSATLTGASAITQLAADLTGRAQLRLVVTDSGNGNDSDHADWANAQLICSGGSDTTPPTVTTTSPVAGATGVAVTASVTGTFSEAMTASTLTTATVTVAPSANLAAVVSATVTYTAATTSVTLVPAASLTASTAYTATIKGGSSGAKDTAGNALAVDKAWTFTTAAAADTTPPTVTTTSPAAGATGVAVTASVTGTFSEAMTASTLTTTTVTLAPSANLAAVVAATVTYTAATTSVTLVPAASLTASTAYTATIKGGSSGAKDTAGNALAVDKVWTFTTAASGGGTTTFVSDLTWTSMTNGWGPAEKDRSNGESAAGDGAVLKLRGVTYTKGLGVHAASNIAYVVPAGCTQFISDVGIDDEVAPGGSVTFQVWADSVMRVESAVLTGASAATQLVVDLTGRSLFGLVVTDGGNGNASDHADWANARLICGGSAADTTPPTVTTTSPAAGATGVAITANVTATFSEAMTASTLTTTTVTLAPSSNLTALVAGTVTYTAASNTVTFAPSASLTAGTAYTATIKSGASGAKDAAGNALAANKVWTFTTAADTTPPTVTTTSPLAGATGVAITASVTATFSEAMTASTLTTTTVTLAPSASLGAVVAATVTYTAATNTVTLAPTASLTPSTAYTATIKSGASGAKDAAGNALAANKVWTFTTAADTTPPTVTTTSPASGGTGFAVSANVTATFSEAMTSGSLTTTTVTLAPSANLAAVVAGAVTYTAATNTVTLNPMANLANNTAYTATIKSGASGAKDAAGNPLASNKVWTFTTAP